MTLTDFLRSCGFHTFEGYCQEVPEQIAHLRQLAQTPNIRILEIGFNAGHSSDIFLENETSTVVSFDLGEHVYVRHAKEYIDRKYPGRHTLILGDSRNTLPAYIRAHPNTSFDLIFIDGGHSYDVATADLVNCAKLAHSNTTVILDDAIFDDPLWNPEPARAWVNQVHSGLISEIHRVTYSHGRAATLGTYLGVESHLSQTQ